MQRDAIAHDSNYCEADHNIKIRYYYRCVEDHFEQLETVWDDRYQSRFGFWRSYVTDVIRRYLDCGDLQ